MFKYYTAVYDVLEKPKFKIRIHNVSLYVFRRRARCISSLARVRYDATPTPQWSTGSFKICHTIAELSHGMKLKYQYVVGPEKPSCDTVCNETTDSHRPLWVTDFFISFQFIFSSYRIRVKYNICLGNHVRCSRRLHENRYVE